MCRGRAGVRSMTRRGSLQGRGYRSRGKVGSESPRFAQGPCTKASRPKDRGARSGAQAACSAPVRKRAMPKSAILGLAVSRRQPGWPSTRMFDGLRSKVEKSDLMYAMRRFCDRRDQQCGIPWRHWTGQPSLERPSGDVFEHEVVPGANLADAVNDDYAGMPHQRKRLCLLVPAFSWLLVGSFAAAGITLSATWRPRASCWARVNHSHGAPTQFFLNLKTENLGDFPDHRQGARRRILGRGTLPCKSFQPCLTRRTDFDVLCNISRHC